MPYIPGIIAILVRYTLQAAINDKHAFNEYPNEEMYLPVDYELINEILYDIHLDPNLRSRQRIKVITPHDTNNNRNKHDKNKNKNKKRKEKEIEKYEDVQKLAFPFLGLLAWGSLAFELYNFWKG